MTEFIETTKNNPKTQKQTELIVDKYSKESSKTQTQMSKKHYSNEKLVKKQ